MNAHCWVGGSELSSISRAALRYITFHGCNITDAATARFQILIRLRWPASHPHQNPCQTPRPKHAWTGRGNRRRFASTMALSLPYGS